MADLRLGTRSSRLALAQSEAVRALLADRHLGLQVDLVTIETRGDQDRTTPLAEGTGWFTSALQQALLAGDIDLAVHSYKDLPTARPDGLTIAAVPLREDPRDAVVARDGIRLSDLPPGARVGTSSPRRHMQVLALNPKVTVEPIRGNVDTRLRKVDEGEYDATVLALAGLKRLGLEDRATQVLGVEEFLPAPAQGALAVECRSDDQQTLALLRAIDDPALRTIVAAERSFLARLQAGCSFPAAAYAEVFGSTIKLHGLVAPDGQLVRSKIGGPVEAASGLGKSLAEELMRHANM